MRRLSLIALGPALALALAFYSPAPAQNPQCRTPALGTATPECASTAFVNNARNNSVKSLGGMIGDLLCGAGLTCSSQTVALTNPRTLPNAPVTLYVATTGNDTTGAGTLANPWRTVGKAYAVLQTSYDLSSCQNITIQLADGTYTASTQLNGGVLGQCSPTQITINGNAVTPTNVLVQPTAAAGYAFSASFGAQYRLQNMVVDQSNNWNNPVNGADIVSVSPSSKIYFGPGMTFGCNFGSFNAVTIAFSSFVEFDNDFTIDVGRCQKIPIGTIAIGTSTITALSSTTGIGVGMGIIGSGVPVSARVFSVSGTTVTYVCASSIVTCTSTSNATETITFVGGGQTFLDLGNGAQVYFNTNGQPDFSIIATLANFPTYSSGFFFVNDNSSMNAQAITFANASQAYGSCVTVTNMSSLDTGQQGIPYAPCLNGSAAGIAPNTTATITSGSASATVTSASGISVGNIINGVATPTATFTAGNAVVAVSSATGICVGAHATGPGILAGATVTAINGTNITLGGCGSGPKCVAGSPTYLSETNVGVYFTGCGIANGTVVTSVSGTTVGLSRAATATGTQNVIVEGTVSPWYGSVYQ